MKFALRIMLACLLAAGIFANAGETQSPATGADVDDAECVPFTQALEKAGEIACVTGKVVEVHTIKDRGHIPQFLPRLP